MNDLYLTDDQVAELMEMCLAGEIAADELRLWRKASPAPWSVQKNEFDEYAPFIGDQLFLFHAHAQERYIDPAQTYADANAAIFSRNTAELRAAAVYWVEVLYRRQLGSDYEFWSRKSILERIDAIAKAYAEMKK